MAGEARVVLRRVRRLPVDESAEPPAARRGILLGVLDHDLNHGGGPRHEIVVESRQRILADKPADSGIVVSRCLGQ